MKIRRGGIAALASRPKYIFWGAFVVIQLCVLYYQRSSFRPLPAAARLSAGDVVVPFESATGVSAGDAVIEWGRKNGAKVQKIKLGTFHYPCCGEVRGVEATEDIFPEDVLIAIPQKLMFTTRVAKQQSPIAHILVELSEKATEFQLLILHVLHEFALGDRSSNKPFLRVLETTNKDMAVQREKGFIDVQSPNYRYYAAQRWEQMKGDYAVFFPGVFYDYPEVFSGNNSHHYTWQKFRWAWAMVTSRYWMMPTWEDDVNESVMAPICDLVNFGQVEMIVRFNKENSMFEMVSKQNYKKGDEVQFYYGDHCADDMLASYGFKDPSMRDCKPGEE